jgi:hypothetical protein
LSSSNHKFMYLYIRSDFGTKIFILDWIGLIKLFRSRIRL